MRETKRSSLNCKEIAHTCCVNEGEHHQPQNEKRYQTLCTLCHSVWFVLPFLFFCALLCRVSLVMCSYTTTPIPLVGARNGTMTKEGLSWHCCPLPRSPSDCMFEWIFRSYSPPRVYAGLGNIYFFGFLLWNDLAFPVLENEYPRTTLHLLHFPLLRGGWYWFRPYFAIIKMRMQGSKYTFTDETIVVDKKGQKHRL
jgi:hypothetical protein